MNGKYAVIGHPIRHSMSPYIHKRLFALTGITIEYFAFDIAPEQLSERIEFLEKLDGFNITIPHKEGIIPFLFETHESAKKYNAVNCVKNDGEKMIGYNTDAYGFTKALESFGIALAGRVLVLGCGGAARTVAREAADRGCHVTLAARESSYKKAGLLKEWIESSGGKADIADIRDIHGDFELCVNATPSGMYPNTEEMPAISVDCLSRCAALFDAVFNPSQTLLMKTALNLGIKTGGGMPMLVWQAAKAHEYWYGATFSEADIKDIITGAEREMAGMFYEK